MKLAVSRGTIKTEVQQALVSDGRTEWCVRTAGPTDGVPLVLVHGWGASAASWEAHLPLFAGCRVIVPDLPGHGVTPGHPTGTDIPGVVDGLAVVTAATVEGP